MRFDDVALTFACHDQQLVGIYSRPEEAGPRGVLIVVGGPQYRAGSHRQFALLARHLAAQGFPVLRFDYRGMGDSEGEARSFDDIDADLRSALDHFFSIAPGMQEVAVWGLCDAASAALFYAQSDPRVTGLVLVNPWIRTAQGQAKAYLKYYYLQRLLQPDFWKKLLRGRFDARRAAASLMQQMRTARRTGPGNEASTLSPVGAEMGADIGADIGANAAASLPQRMLAGMQNFRGRVLIILSGQDLTAREFADVTGASVQWKKLLQKPQVSLRDFPAADHTFSCRAWRDQVASWTADWLNETRSR